MKKARSREEFIFMADIVGSRALDQQILMNDFREVVNAVNKTSKKNFLSPMTITLGDEFQSVVKDLSAGLDIILKIEETIVIKGKIFKLRYVLVEGKIETPINREIGYGMLGEGLTAAREQLSALKNSKDRFYFRLKDEKRTKVLNKAFFVMQGFIDGWRIKMDYYIVSGFFKSKDYKQVAEDLDKNPSLMWKRKKSLHLEEYFALKEVIKYLGGE